jgi:hypothetical protein
MKTNRIAMMALLAAFAAGAALAQSDPYGPPGYPGGQGPQGQYGQQEQGYGPGQYEDDWRESDNWYDQQSNDGYGQNGQYDPYGHNGGYDDRYQPAAEVGFFYGALSPYGEWVRHPYYGWVWFPRNVHAGWRPYSIGRWVMSDYGWTWVSYERFGWATYHYGRWAWDRYVGWLWVPGTDWAPAWVAWQQGNGYIGWAPLPPAVGFDLRVGIQLGGFNLSFGIAPRNYAFVDERRFLEPRVSSYIVPEARNVTIIHNTTNITNYTVVDNRVINQGVPVDRVERVTGRRAQRMRIAQASTPGSTVVERDVVRIYRPAETKLESVKVAQRNNAGLRKVAKPEKQSRDQAPGQAPATRPNRPAEQQKKGYEVPIPVAPRVPPAPAKVNERKFAHEQQDLKAIQQKPQQELQQMQRREKSQAATGAQEAPKGKAQGTAKAENQGAANGKGQGAGKVDPQEVQKRHAAELEEQRLLRERTAEQLKNRQQLQRQAAKVTAEQENAKAKTPPPAEQPKKKGKKAKPEAEDNQKDPKNQNGNQKPPQPR